MDCENFDEKTPDKLADLFSSVFIRLNETGAEPTHRLGGERPESPVNARGNHNGSQSSPGVEMEQEKRIRREIANSNERRRMQSINAGFQSLRTLLPHHEGEKLSKAAILQQTAEYIYQLEQEKTRLLSQNCHLKRLLNQHEGEASASKKRKLDSDIEVETVAGTTNDLIDVRVQLDRERRLRMILEEQVRSLESQLYPERIREITQQVQLQYQHHREEVVEFKEEPMRRDLLNGSAETVAAVANLQVVSASSLQPVAHTETVIATVTSPPQSPSPRLPSILEAAIKAEPKVEVERLPSPHSVSPSDDRLSHPSSVYLASTSRQNLETIVEAIRHLEGDNLFSDSVADAPEVITADEPQDAPLALTKHDKAVVKVKMNQFYNFQQQQQQHRPGVIVVSQQT